MTGALMAWGHPSWRAVAIGPYRVVPLVHELTGALFLLVPVAPSLFGRGASLGLDLADWARLRWGGRFNFGQRLNGLFTLLSMVVLGATGIAIWLGRAVPRAWQEPAYELHVLTALLAFAVFVGHLAMALAHPRALRTMLTGKG